VMVILILYSVSGLRSSRSNSSWGVAIRSFGGAKTCSCHEFMSRLLHNQIN
jgi:hypothetical protein